MVRQNGGAYAERSSSRCLPSLPLPEFDELIRTGIEHGQWAAINALPDRLLSV